jgi:hypothetical protein
MNMLKKSAGDLVLPNASSAADDQSKQSADPRKRRAPLRSLQASLFRIPGGSGRIANRRLAVRREFKR